MSASFRRRDAKLLSGLAGAAALAVGSQAYAQGTAVPIATPADIPLPPVGGQSALINWNPNGDAIQDFQFQFRFPGPTSSQVKWQSNMSPVNGAVTGTSVLGYLAIGYNFATNFVPDINVTTTAGPAGTSFRNAAQVILGSLYGPGAGTNYGGFGNGGSGPGVPPGNPGGGQPQMAEGIAVFRVGQGATARLGWLHLRTSSTVGIDFIAAGLGSPGGDIVTGRYVPEPASLALLAMGAAAVLARPRRGA
jgi:hypothetical protein